MNARIKFYNCACDENINEQAVCIIFNVVFGTN